VEGEKRALALSCWAGCWRWAALRREKGGRERGGQAAGKKKEWAEPKSSEGESLSLFIFCFSFLLKQTYFKTFSKQI